MKKAARKVTTKKTATKKTGVKGSPVKATARKAASFASSTGASKAPGRKASTKKIALARASFVDRLAAIMANHWKVVDAWFASNDPEHAYRPKPPRTRKDESATLARWEEEYGEAFENSLRAHFAGGFAHPSRTFMEYTLLQLPQARDRWRGLNNLADEGVFEKSKPRALDEDNDQIRFVWWSRGFIPIAQDGGGNLICVDLDPGVGGTKGQVIRWEMTEGPFGPISEDLGIYLADYRHALEKGAIAFDDSGMLERRTLRAKGSKAQEELLAAVEAGDAATVSRLLAADKKLLAVRNEYDEPLIIPAIQKKHTDVVKAFLDAGVDANARGPGGRLLGYAMSAASAGSVALLLKRGAIPLIEKHGAPESILSYMLYGATFSDHAPEADYVSMLESLLQAGADPNIPFGGQTPLMKAAAFGSMTLAKRLLEAGAQVDAVDDQGKDAAAHARSRGRQEVAAFLERLAAR